jgi:hypothetical protein
MENFNSELLAEKLQDAILYDEITGNPYAPEERAENLDAVRQKLLVMGGIFEKIDDMSMATRMVFSATFIRVVDTYLETVEKHEELLAAGR